MDSIKQKGFTIIELIVVIAIIAVLAGIIMANVNSFRAKARDARRMSELRELQKAVEIYKAFYNTYPDTGGAWWSYCSAWTQKGANEWIPNLAPEFVGSLPLDPKRGTDRGALDGPPGSGGSGTYTFCYIYNSNGTDYKIAVHCGAELGPINSGQPFYKGHDGWSCGNYAYAVYTPGAVGW